MTSDLLRAGTALAVLGARVLRLRLVRAAEHAEGEENTYGLPDGEPIAEELREWLDRQRDAILDAIPDDRLPDEFPDLDEDAWNDPMAAAMVPKLGVYWDEAGRKTYARLGLDPNDWRVVNPHLKDQIRRQAFAFCQSTNESTSKRLDVALHQLREQLLAGLVTEGESVRELTKRVKNVFETLSTSHARMIAATEASRAVHAAELTADAESEVVAGVELLLSGDACPLCRKIATECKRVPLGQPFAVIGSNPHYSQIKHPPLHPHCQCTIVEVLKPEYGGPLAPDWGQTLQQPQKGLADGYTPPPGKTEPKPEPEKKANPPKPTKPAPKAKPVPPPPEKAAIDQAVAYAATRGVSVETAGGDQIAKYKAADVPAVFRRSDQKVYLNERCEYWRKPAEWMAAANRKQPPWFSSSHEDHIIVHEVGHAKHFAAVGEDRYREVKDRTFTSAEKALVREHVSRYGATQPIEFVAEMYAGLAAGKAYNHEVSILYLSLGGPIP